MDLQTIKSNKVKMILAFSIPSIISMVMTSLINVVDGFFIGNYVGKEGMTAVNLGLPIIYLFLAVGLMMGVGGIAIAGMALGAGDIKKSNTVFNQTMVTVTIVSVILSILMFLGFPLTLKVLGADHTVGRYFKDYYQILLFELPIMIINSSFGMFIRGEGNPQYFMKTNLLNVLLNCVLDYVFARWFHWGVKGIAAASLIAAVVTLGVIVSYFIRKSKVFKLGRFHFMKDVLRSTLLNGSSEFIGEMSMCISMFAYNFVIMRRIGVDGVTAFTIVGYVAYIFSMIIIGFGQGASPLMSFTYGAKKVRLAQSLRKITNGFVLGAGGVTSLVMLLILNWYSGLFVKNVEVQDMVKTGMVIYLISFLFSGINTITSMYFTSIGKAKESAVISSSRGLVVLLLSIFLLPIFFGMNGVWATAPVTEAITLLLSIFFIGKENRTNLRVTQDCF